jgi:histidinol-phosphatase (PHP family)
LVISKLNSGAGWRGQESVWRSAFSVVGDVGPAAAGVFPGEQNSRRYRSRANCALLSAMLCKVDYHTHPQAHTLRPYSIEMLQPWIDRCRERGVESVAFTDHDRYCDGVVFDAIDRLRDQNPDIDILIGIELDNDPVTSERGLNWVEENWNRLDLVLGSVHYFSGEERMFDGTDQSRQIEQRGADRAFSEYIEQLTTLLRRGRIDCLSHLDLVKIHGLFPENYNAVATFDPLLDLIRKNDLAIEINTAGWRKKVGEQYPAAAIVKRAVALEIPITTSSDAHSYVQVAEGFERLEALLEAEGVNRIARFSKHRASV